MGFDNVPEAGELFQVVDDVEKAYKVIAHRKLREKEARKEDGVTDKKLSLQNLFDRLEENKTKTFPLIIKADNFSSAEVLETVLLKQSHEKKGKLGNPKGRTYTLGPDLPLGGDPGVPVSGFLGYRDTDGAPEAVLGGSGQ